MQRTRYAPILIALASLAGCCLQPAPESLLDAGLPDAGLQDAGPPDGGSADGGLPFCLEPLPSELTFGTVLEDTTATQSITLANCGAEEIVLTLGALSGTDPGLFQTGPIPGSKITLQSKDMLLITVTFQPLIGGSPEAPLEFGAFLGVYIGGCNNCVEVVQLRGEAVYSCLEPEPSVLDFGVLPVGQTATSAVTLKNICSNARVFLTADPVVLNSDATGALIPAGPYQLGQPSATHDTVLEPGGSAVVTTTFAPPHVSEFSGELDVRTDNALASDLKLPIKGAGGGPIILCSPPMLDFGLNSVGSTSVLAILCTNIGRDVPGDPASNLMISDLSFKKGNQGFQATFGPTYLPDAGFAAPGMGLVAGGNQRIDITYAPTLLGTNVDELTISSNAVMPPSTCVIDMSGTAR